MPAAKRAERPQNVLSSGFSFAAYADSTASKSMGLFLMAGAVIEEIRKSPVCDSRL